MRTPWRRVGSSVMHSRGRRAREIESQIAAILLHDWDPIGVADEPQARDEYDSYVGGVYRLLASGGSLAHIEAHLRDIEVRMIGGDKTTREAAVARANRRPLPAVERHREPRSDRRARRPTRWSRLWLWIVCHASAEELGSAALFCGGSVLSRLGCVRPLRALSVACQCASPSSHRMPDDPASLKRPPIGRRHLEGSRAAPSWRPLQPIT